MSLLFDSKAKEFKLLNLKLSKNKSFGPINVELISEFISITSTFSIFNIDCIILKKIHFLFFLLEYN